MGNCTQIRDEMNEHSLDMKSKFDALFKQLIGLSTEIHASVTQSFSSAFQQFLDSSVIDKKITLALEARVSTNAQTAIAQTVIDKDEAVYSSEEESPSSCSQVSVHE